jgi:hypothetical protein
VSGKRLTAHVYFSRLAEPENFGTMTTVRKHAVLWESESVCRIYPALFVIRTLTANRKLNDLRARS